MKILVDKKPDSCFECPIRFVSSEYQLCRGALSNHPTMLGFECLLKEVNPYAMQDKFVYKGDEDDEDC